MAVHYTATMNRWKVQVYDSHASIPSYCTPVGSVEFCLNILGMDVKPDYYPYFLKEHFYRNVWLSDTCDITKEPIFIKPADRYKRFDGVIANKENINTFVGPYWCSGVLSFLNEWRYYITNGKVVASGWYSGSEDVADLDAPKLNINIPETYCGALDFGTVVEYPDTIVLVEANHPFACGWYGKDHSAYTQWLIDGWKYMLALKDRCGILDVVDK